MLQREDGATLVESAVSLVTLFTALMGIAAGSLIVYADLFVSSSAHMATRYAMVRGSSFAGTACATTTTENCAATSANVDMYVRALAPLGIMNGTPLTVTTLWPGIRATGLPCTLTRGANSPGCLVTVVVIYNYNYSLPFVPGNTLLLLGQSSVMVSQ